MEETKARDKFRLHSMNYYQKMLKAVPFIKLLVAEHDGKIIAGNIVSFFGDMATYIHGGSSDEKRNVMAPYLLQWQAIKIAKEKNLKYYDFNGINERLWPGVTRFKKGFGGEEVNYPGTFDLIFNYQKYIFYNILRQVRRKI
jgi:lipid II:glycine glycyltransferase (peptidoglycan interpeptide bridge formation enzyme)